MIHIEYEKVVGVKKVQYKNLIAPNTISVKFECISSKSKLFGFIITFSSGEIFGPIRAIVKFGKDCEIVAKHLQMYTNLEAIIRLYKRLNLHVM